jgi:osmotically-inducible protein OsmY
MKKTVAFALMLGLAGCGDNMPVAPVSAAPIAKAQIVEAVKADPDHELTERVARAIEAAKLQGIEAVAASGIVTLWGTTLSARERDRAAEVARNVQGVEWVENRLEVVAGS